MTKTNRKVVAVMRDLMFMVQVQQAAKKAGLETVAVKTRADALAKAVEEPLLMVIDLNDATLEPVELIRNLKAEPGTRVIYLLGFVSHVNTDLRSEAVASGCDMVVPRSAFAQRLPAVIESLEPK